MTLNKDRENKMISEVGGIQCQCGNPICLDRVNNYWLTKMKEQIELAVRERENELKQIAQEYKDKGFELETFIYSGFIKDLSTSPKE